MHRVERSILVPYTAGQMFDLVADVPAYPRFLPWCPGARQRVLEDGRVQATVEIGYRGVHSHFTTRNTHREPESIELELVEGPFRRLHGKWTFKALRADACKVHLSLHYQFVPGLLGRAVAPVFESIAGSLVDAFAQRARALFDKAPDAAERA